MQILQTKTDMNAVYRGVNIDRRAFNETVYTPLSDAIEILKERENNKEIQEYVERILPAGIPDIVTNNKCAFLSRDIETPNYELIRFLDIVNDIKDIKPLIWTYYSDIFTPNVNYSKHSLGKMTFLIGRDNGNFDKIRHVTVTDFNTSNGKKISEIHTLWNQSFIEFHNELLKKELSDSKIKYKTPLLFDASEWYEKSGGDVRVYYKYIIALFLKHGILFENFMLEDNEEINFVKNVFLPCLKEIIEEIGYKPLIVPLEPINGETKKSWFYYPPNLFEYVKSKLNLI